MVVDNTDKDGTEPAAGMHLYWFQTRHQAALGQRRHVRATLDRVDAAWGGTRHGYITFSRAPSTMM